MSSSGYRLYSDQDLERLQQVLYFRELGFGLKEITTILDRPDFDRREALEQHRHLLSERQARLGRLIRSLDRTLEAMEEGAPMDKEMFDGFDPGQYDEEARQRWGQTEAYKESVRRAKRYTKADWAAIKAEQEAIEEGLADLMDREPADPAVQALVRRHHRLVNDRFYNCSPEMYKGLGNLYTADARFAAHYDQRRPGLARFMTAAVMAYWDCLERNKG